MRRNVIRIPSNARKKCKRYSGFLSARPSKQGQDSGYFKDTVPLSFRCLERTVDVNCRSEARCRLSHGIMSFHERRQKMRGRDPLSVECGRYCFDGTTSSCLRNSGDASDPVRVGMDPLADV